MNKKFLSLIIPSLLFTSCNKTSSYVSPKGAPDYSTYSATNKMRVSGWIAPYHGNFDIYENPDLISQESYNHLKDCGFNAIYAMYEYSYSHETAILNSLDYAQNAGINYYAKTGTIFNWEKEVKQFNPGDFANDSLIKKYKNHPAFAGHLVCDEPNIEYFDSLKARKDFYETEFPGKEYYINIFPSYASTEQLGCESYDEYLNSFINKLNPQVLSFDHYSLTKSGGLPHCKSDSLYNR